MNKELSVILLNKLGTPYYLDRTSGLVQTFERVIESDGGAAVTKRIPVSSFATFQECTANPQAQISMVPNSKFKSVLYFEDNGITGPTMVRAGAEYLSRVRLVCWLNTKLIAGQSNMGLTTMIISDIIKKLSGNPFNSSPFTKIAVKIGSIPPQDKSIFSKYDYSEKETQYLMAPFEYFALDLNVTYTIPFGCVDDSIINPAPVVLTKFGMLVHSNQTLGEKIAVVQSFGVECARDKIFLSDGGTSSSYQQWVDAGLKVLLAAKWGDSSQEGNNTPVPFPTDMVDYAQKLTAATLLYQPELWAIEDEEDNQNFHSGPISDYIIEMTTASSIIHAAGGKCTNGGIHSNEICILVYYDMLDRGLITKAGQFKDRTFSDGMKAYILNPSSQPDTTAAIELTDTLIHAYKDAGMDYINLHWKEPLNGVGDGSSGVVGGYADVCEYLTRVGGLPVLSNELGIKNSAGSPQLVTDMLTQALQNNFAYAIWFNTDDDGQILNEPDGTFTANGNAFKNFIDAL